MNAKTGRRDRVRFSVERRVAPHVEPEWAEAVLLELRLRGVRGEGIGAALAEVDAHCVDSSLTADEAFGDPVEFARSLDLPTEPPLSPGDLVDTVVPVTVQVLGMLATPWGVGAWVDGERLSLTVGHLAMLALVAGLDLALLWAGEPLVRVAVHRPVAVVVGAAVLPLAGVTTLLAVLDHEVAAVPAPPVALLGAAVVAAVQVYLLHRARLRHDQDPVVDPLAGPVPPDPLADRVLSALTTWQVPIWTVLMSVTVALLAAFS